MGQGTQPALLMLISAAVTPIVLVTATAILLGNHTAKYNAIALQMRGLTAEYRAPTTPELRQASLRQQLKLFRYRIHALWAASTCLYLALLCFLVTVLAVVFVAGMGVGNLATGGAVSLVAGLLLMVVTAVLELREVWLARQTAAEELRDTTV